MTRWWRRRRQNRNVSGQKKWILPILLVGILLSRSVQGTAEASRSKFDRLPVPEYATMDPIAVNYPLTPPVSGAIVSGFGYRQHPVTKEKDFHTGIDISVTEGTPVSAVLPGTVTEVGYDGIYGNYVRMSHGVNIETRYCHCSKILVENGTHLREGERVALSGSTGMVTGPHLHFEVWVDGLLADPATALEVHHNA